MAALFVGYGDGVDCRQVSIENRGGKCPDLSPDSVQMASYDMIIAGLHSDEIPRDMESAHSRAGVADGLSIAVGFCQAQRQDRQE